MCAFHSPGRKNGFAAACTIGALTAPTNDAFRTTDARLAALRFAAPDARMVRIIEMIQAEPLCRITDLAREFNLSHSHLEHIFKKQTGVPLGQLLAEQRLHRAAHLLRHTNMRIKEIAQTIGYEHTSSFVRAFERHFAKAPRLYRRESSQSILQTDACAQPELLETVRGT